MSINESIKSAREGFEASFLEKDYYEKQTIDGGHLKMLMDMMEVKRNQRKMNVNGKRLLKGYVTIWIISN